MPGREMRRLDTHALAERVRSGGHKLYLLARQVGVHPRTVSRWCAGKVKRIDADNLRRLAAALKCSPELLTLNGEVDALATSSERRRAAREIAERDLLQLLSPSDNWELAEQLIKATAGPELPLHDLGRLYNLLSVTSWRQGEYARAQEYARQAREAGERADYPPVVHKAEFNLAVVDSMEGRHALALKRNLACLAEPGKFESRRDYGSALANTSMIYKDMAQFGEALAMQRKATRVFTELDAQFNLAISWAMTMLIENERGKHRAALTAARRSQDYARQCGFSRQVVQAELVARDALSLAGDTKKAANGLEPTLAEMAKHQRYDYQVHESAARVLRRAGDLRGAHEQCEVGLARMDRWPLMRAMMHEEQARLALAEGDAPGEARLREKANRIHHQTGLTRRVRELPVVEFGQMFS